MVTKKKDKKDILTLQTYFPTVIGVALNPDHKAVEDKLTKKCLEIRKKVKKGPKEGLADDTYNTLLTHDLSTDPDFSGVNEFVTNQVIEYCKAQSIDLNCLSTNAVDSWLNIYKKNNSQEWHIHSNVMVSASYYLRCNDSSAKIYFKTPVTDMMSPNILSYNDLNFTQVWFQPKPGTVLIFRSYLAHCVGRQKNNDIRISLSYNFRKKYD